MSRANKQDMKPSELKSALDVAAKKLKEQHSEPYAIFSKGVYNKVKELDKYFWRREYKHWKRIYVIGRDNLFIVDKNGELRRWRVKRKN